VRVSPRPEQLSPDGKQRRASNQDNAPNWRGARPSGKTDLVTPSPVANPQPSSRARARRRSGSGRGCLRWQTLLTPASSTWRAAGPPSPLQGHSQKGLVLLAPLGYGGR
jgi:hypothetical protein